MGGGASLEATTALASDILQDKTAYNGEGNLITGSIINRGSLSCSISAGRSKEFESGYYSGGTITTESVYVRNIGVARLKFPAHYGENSTSTSVNTGHTILGMATGDVMYIERLVNWSYAGWYKLSISYSGSTIYGTITTAGYMNGAQMSPWINVAYLY